MITNIRIRNFKTLEDAEFKLGAAPVVLVGPNNSGKTSILQALTMWHVGASEWMEHHTPKKNGGVLRGVNIPANHFLALPPTSVVRLWHKRRAAKPVSGKLEVVTIQVDVSGESGGVPWNIGVEFLRSGRDMVVCRPIPGGIESGESSSDVAARWRKALPQVEFIPPMSGMAWREDKLTPGSILSRLGEGRTADVLRNILYQVRNPEGIFSVSSEQAERRWEKINEFVERKFMVSLNSPGLGPRGTVVATYQEDGIDYALSSGGRGFHQTLLMLALLHLRPGALFLLDEPDAHLEGVRQRDNFSEYADIAEKNNSQLIIASHSEVVMKEAVPEGIVGVVRGKATPLSEGEIGQFKKLLTDIGWDKIMAAKIAGNAVFLEGGTDLNILAAFAERLFGSGGAAAAEKIRRANAEFIGNDVPKAISMFTALRSGIPNFRGFALFDRDVADKFEGKVDGMRKRGMRLEFWGRHEMENYILLPETLYRFAEAEDAARRQAESEDPETPELPLAPPSEKTNAELMREVVEDLIPRLMLKDRRRDFWRDQKMSNLIVQIMEEFSKRTGGAGAWSKRKCHTLVQHMKPEEIPGEVRDKIVRLLAVIDPDFNPESPDPEKSE